MPLDAAGAAEMQGAGFVGEQASPHRALCQGFWFKPEMCLQ